MHCHETAFVVADGLNSDFIPSVATEIRNERVNHTHLRTATMKSLGYRRKTFPSYALGYTS